MKTFCDRFLVPFLLATALVAGPVRGQNAAPAAPPPPDKPVEATSTAPAAAPVAVDQPAATPPATSDKSAAPSTAAVEKSPAPAENAKPATAPEPAAKAEEAKPVDQPESAARADKAESDDEDEDRGDVKVPGVHVASNNVHDRVRVMGDVTVPEGTTVKGDAVAVMGDLQVNGEVMHDAVAVMGDNTINGHVHHDVVAVMGDLNLGPKAQVDGSTICVGGELHRDPGARVRGDIVEKPIGEFKHLGELFGKTLKLGRPLAFGAHLGWLWILTAFSVAFYALLALLFPGAVRRCGDKIVLEPGMTILAAVLSLIGLPVLFILLCITVVGIPIALLVLPVSLVLCGLFGKAAVYALVGRKITGDRYHLAVATILGALIFVVLYLVPFAGLLLALLVWFVGFGAVVLTMFASRSKPSAGSATPPAAQTVPPPANLPTAAMTPPVIVAAVPLAVASEATAPIVPPPTEPPPAPASVPPTPAAPTPVHVAALPPVLDAMTLPRAGFWIRLAASALDFFLVAVLSTILAHTIVERSGPGLIFITLGVYSAALWKSRGSTIGGVICGIKVVRLDGRPIDWTIAFVRAGAAGLSFAVAGLGFIWVAIDPEKQSWHDKVAGTTIVRVPKGTPLV